MKIQADITTYLLERDKQKYFINNYETKVADLLRISDIDIVRISFFTKKSALIPISKSMALIKELVQNNISAFLCIHCSDFWADPSHQKVPKEWGHIDGCNLISVFIEYLTNIFEQVKKSGIRVKYLQVGNEISNGLLWPFMQKSYQFVNVVKIAHSMCRSFFPDAQIVLHTDLSYSQEKAHKWYSLMKARNVDYDLIGLSYYPVWHGTLHQLSQNIQGLYESMHKKIMLCEIGYMNTQTKTTAWFGDWQCEDIPYSPDGQRDYILQLKIFTKQHALFLNSEIFYWGMFSSQNPDHHPVSLFNESGHALPAFYNLNKSDEEY